LISKANRLSDAKAASADARSKQLLAAVAYFDMALLLMKPYDPNYATVANWKCNILINLEQYEEAVAWYREIVSISDATDGKSGRNATAKLAEEMIAKYSGMGNCSLPSGGDTDASFDDPPYCMHAEEFCSLLVERKFKKAYSYLAPTLQQKMPLEALKKSWLSMIGTAKVEALSVLLERHMLDWPNRKNDEIGWCYFSLSSDGISEGISLIVARTPHHGYWLTEIEFGRP
jgi:hypothetical protein